MKKILILLFFTFMATGCYDYKELSSLAVVSGIAIDYDNDKNEYLVSFEILNDDKIAENLESSTKTYYVNGSGRTITDAFNNTNLEINKIPYFAHVKILLISELIAEEHANNIINFLIRNVNITNNFYVVLAKDYEASLILQNTSTENRIISESIYNFIDNTDLGNNLSVKINLDKYTTLIVNPMQDIYLPSVTLENDKIKLQGIAIFEKNKLANILDFNESQTLNILLNENKNAYYKIKCEDDENKYTIIDIYKQKIDYKINKYKFELNVNLMARIEENQCNYNLKSKKTYKELEKKFNSLVDDDFEKLVNTLLENNSDVLGINYKYYKNHNKTLKFEDLNYNVKTNININRNGLIFEVTNDNK